MQRLIIPALFVLLMALAATVPPTTTSPPPADALERVIGVAASTPDAPGLDEDG